MVAENLGIYSVQYAWCYHLFSFTRRVPLTRQMSHRILYHLFITRLLSLFFKSAGLLLKFLICQLFRIWRKKVTFSNASGSKKKYQDSKLLLWLNKFSENERTQLNSFRYACTVLSSVVVYGLAYAFLQSSETDELGWADRKIFTTLAIIVVGIGSVFSVIFHLLTPEKKPRGPNE